ncbi:hypothetical protein MXMO3_01664 [Maritalea myrionectae]|uniref:Uncharacterized protein n=1 Tax=Maritalea myrionectae TaxID=454601 RepID=A0A2R4MDV2_9HYPH|nr:nuclease domain-containing protein [Maritalea myrionectae]AVX04190.1 hypothetical protein MXMO3_01664 [Maritalea myrionectae]
MIHSKKYTDAARGQPCTLRIAGVTCAGPETTVSCHVRDRFKGMGCKASDLSTVDGCFNCHKVFDGQGDFVLSQEDWLFYALRGLQETQANRVARGLLFVTGFDPEKPKKRKSGKKVRSGKPIQSRPFQNKGRKLGQPYQPSVKQIND